MKTKTQKTLKDIVELANRLESHQFEHKAFENGLFFRVTENPSGDGYLLHFEYPDDTVIDATLYTFRLFDQIGEAFSFHKLDKLAEDYELSDEFRDEIIRIRKSYFDYLSQYPTSIEPVFFEDGLHPNNGDILRVVINGGFGHRKDFRKREQYITWTRDEIREGVLYQEFSKIVLFILRLIRRLQILSEKELKAG